MSASIIWDTYASTLNRVPENTVSRKLLVHEQDGERRRLVAAPYIVLNLHRMDPHTMKFIPKSIIPTQHINLPDGQRFTLSAVVVWLDSHYTAYLRCQNSWYYNDDTSGKGVELVGGYFDILHKTRSRPGICKNGTMYFYAETRGVAELYNL
jgi:hypothetical protein